MQTQPIITTQPAKSIATESLQSRIGRIARLETERAELGADIKEILAELKSQGHNLKAIKEAVRRIKFSKKDEEAAALIDTYSQQLTFIF